MTQPTPYSPAFSFTDFSAGSPSVQQPGTRLDGEFDAIANTLARTLANLAKIQRDDGALINSGVGLDQLDRNVRALLAGNASTIDVGFIMDALGTSRTVAPSQRAVTDAIGCTPEQFGAVADGVANDTEALQAALATGQDVILPIGKIYRYHTALRPAANFQRISGGGVLRPVGDIDGIFVGDGLEGIELDVSFNAPEHLGTAVRISGAHRTRVRRLLIEDAFSALHVEGANTTNVDYIWSQLRGKGITWYGNDALRSDLLFINYALIGQTGAPGQLGLDWNGNCASLEVKYLGLIGGMGAVIRNTDGVATFPAIGRFDHFESDYSNSYGIDIRAGLDYDISVPYILGPALSGIRVDASINSFQVRVGGGKSVGSYGGYGIENHGGPILLAGNTDLSSNFSGETSGECWTTDKRLALDDSFYLLSNAGTPLVSFDINDYLTYDRATNTLYEYIGGTAVRATTATSTAFAGQVNVPRAIVSDTPLAAPISINGIPSQYYRVQNLMVNDVPPGSSSFGQGQLQVLFADNTKPVTDIICKSRGTTIGASAAIAAGDQIYQQLWYGDTGPGLGSYMAHAGWIKVAIDGAPLGDPTEIPGWYGLATGTGLHIPGSRYAMEINSKQQVHFPGPLSNALGPTGASYGANVLLGVGAAAAGSAPLKFIPAAAVLLTTPESGAFEVDSTGNFYGTNAAGTRGKFVQVGTPTTLAAALPTDGSATNADIATAINTIRTALIAVGIGS